MTRYFVTFATLLATIGWLVLSYMPQVAGRLPQLSFDSEFAAWSLPILASLTLLAFIGLQVNLVGATRGMFRHAPGSDEAEAVALFNLTRGRELFWTVIPLVSTAMLAFWLWAAR
ncbi:MAG: hypothetical protein M9936_09115 [Caldilinea sp.]|nr:hypothetical protein [Caldilinea sp.]MCB9120900.1 hypothetical protein [Caldilineaceae bacterium]MCO5209839.1 hypothetical protein [Caldilinea sp.]